MRVTGAVGGACLVLCVVALPDVGLAQETISAAQRLTRAEICYEEYNFACARDELAHARAALATLTESQRISALRLSAETALAMRDSTAAHTHLLALLEAQPRFSPPGKAWPKPWLKALAAARAAAPDRLPPTLQVALPVGPVPAGKALPIEVRATDRSGVAGVTLFLVDRRPLALTTTDGRTWRTTIPADQVVPPEVLLWAESMDQRQNGPARWGSARAPKRIEVAAEVKDGGLVTKWWFWTAIGGAVAVATATGITVWLLTRDEDTPSSPEGPGSQTGGTNVRLKWPYP